MTAINSTNQNQYAQRACKLWTALYSMAGISVALVIIGAVTALILGWGRSGIDFSQAIAPGSWTMIAGVGTFLISSGILVPILVYQEHQASKKSL